MKNFNVDTDTASFWINPSSTDFALGAAPTATFSGLTGSTRTSLDRFFLRQDSTTLTPSLQIDELRVGTTWADVTPVPEPSTILAVASGGLLLLARRRTRLTA